jgi:branched-chain amino acid transport system permease protein
LLAAGLAFYVAYVRGATWRRLRAIRHDELSASVLGINVQREKANAFALGSAYSAIGGIFLFYFIGVLVPEDAGVVRSLEQIGTVLLGGAGYALGPVVGSFLVDWFFHIAGYTARYETLIYGAVFLLAVMYAPEGSVGLLARLLARVQPKSDENPATKHFDGDAATAPVDRPELRLSVRNVSQSFGGVHALSNVSFDVRAGEVFTLVGPNGAGKTTMFNIVSGVLSPTSGQIILNNEDITRRAVHDRARDIGRSFQTPRLVPEFTVLANVLLRIDQLMPRLSEREREALVVEQLRIFELDSLATHKVAEISLGQRKLIDIVRACVGNPSLVLLDEPAVGLSSDELKHLAQVIRTLSAHQCAVVVVEHNIEFLAEIAERGIVLDSGKIIAEGAVQEIMTSENVKAAYFGALS